MECNANIFSQLKSFYLIIATFVVLLGNTTAQAQNTSNFEAGYWSVETTLGLSYMWGDMAVLDNSIDLDQAEATENSLRFKALFRGNYTIFDQLMLGAHGGFGYLSYDASENNVAQSFQNYILGLHLRYYVDLNSKFSVFVETGGNQNFLRNESLLNQDYQKWYTDVGIQFKLDRNWWITVHLSDVLYYYSDSPNFENRTDFGIGKPLKDFVNFPIFGIQYQID
ncbi:MAG: hypothetical protein ACQESK_00865 [Bacteroidota bacterium]